MTKRIKTAVATLVASTAVALGACGGALPTPMDVPPGLDGDQAEMARAEAQINRVLGAPPAQPYASPPPPPPSAPGGLSAGAPSSSAGPHAESPRPAPAPAEASQQAQSSDQAQPETPCTTALRALASMERAVTHLCELTGEGDDRCGGARDRLRQATDRVHGQCPG